MEYQVQQQVFGTKFNFYVDIIISNSSFSSFVIPNFPHSYTNVPLEVLNVNFELLVLNAVSKQFQQNMAAVFVG